MRWGRTAAISAVYAFIAKGGSRDVIRLKEKFKRPVARVLLGVWIATTLFTVVANVAAWADDPKPDPAGSATGAAANAFNASGAAFSADDLKKLTDNKDKPATNADLLKALDTIGQGHIATNIVWTLVTAFLVMFMQAGFALVETGFCRAKNAAHVMMTNFMIYGIGMLGFWICGFALMFGAVGAVGSLGGTAGLVTNDVTIHLGKHAFGLFATHGFFLTGDVYDVGILTLFLFQMVFMDTTATIPTGAMAERWKYSAFVVYGFFVSMILYPIYGNWAWGGGWLSTLGKEFGLGNGYCDFAGSGVVHAVGGFCGLAGAMVLCPRIGKDNRDGTVKPIPPPHLPMHM